MPTVIGSRLMNCGHLMWYLFVSQGGNSQQRMWFLLSNFESHKLGSSSLGHDKNDSISLWMRLWRESYHKSRVMEDSFYLLTQVE